MQPTAVAAAAHAFLAPSSAARWVACPGSARMEAQFPEAGDAEAAAEGEAAHWCAQQMFEGWAGEVLLQDGKTDKGLPVTLDMVEAAALLVKDVNEAIVLHGGRPFVEAPLRVPRVHPTLCWGTPDVRMWSADVAAGTRTLFVWDFKFGHKFVDAFENWQLLTYAAGCMSEANEWAQANGQPAFSEDRINIVLRVVQPRAYHPSGPVREWRLTAVKLRDYVHQLAMAAEEAVSPVAECKPQPDACENCKARHACPALQRAVYRGMDLAHQAQAGELSPDALGLELRYLTDAAALMKARLTGLTMQAEMLMRQGQRVAHWRMASAQSRLVWRVADAEALAAGQMLGMNLARPPEPITPTQARDRGFPEPMIAALAHRPPAGMKLELDDGSAARRIFS